MKKFLFEIHLKTGQTVCSGTVNRKDLQTWTLHLTEHLNKMFKGGDVWIHIANHFLDASLIAGWSTYEEDPVSKRYKVLQLKIAEKQLEDLNRGESWRGDDDE